ncbi:hypothetical protein [Sphingomonas sp. BAUL-RG-20F-R05-02]|uniref:hypothetical protein n=1 Tax=Sphingomonas sp. BAUL-RG-20F-R05-02 TaxID=2914830 RepID=UPI001F5707E0|nr:hypothetical protein [Sphingomonas sp. BAUL-RG-20F-R05-02]
MIDHYEWRGGREAMLRFGPDTGPLAIIAMPLFEEANRLRAFAVSLCRALAARGIASALPDLPGQGESLLPTEAARFEDWRAAFAAVVVHVGRSGHGIALRSGAAVDVEAALVSRWRLAPIAGAAVLAELRRATTNGARARGETVAVKIDADTDAPMLLAGNRIALPLFGALADDDAVAATIGVPLRTLRLASDPLPADRKVEGAPLWRRAEPGNDLALAALLADDIAEWITRCGG